MINQLCTCYTLNIKPATIKDFIDIRGWICSACNFHTTLGIFLWQSDCFYNGGWTEDIREVVNYLHQKYPEAPLFTVGTSLGANILVDLVIYSFTLINILKPSLIQYLFKLHIQVKYLGEEGESTPVAGAASICSPWDLLVSEPQ